MRVTAVTEEIFSVAMRNRMKRGFAEWPPELMADLLSEWAASSKHEEGIKRVTALVERFERSPPI